MCSDLVDFVLSCECSSEQKVDSKALKDTLKMFIFYLREKYKKCTRIWPRLLEQEESWLNQDIKIVRETSFDQPGPGRPRKSWEEIGSRAKCRRVSELDSKDFEALAIATAKSAKQKDKNDLALVIKESLKSDENILKNKNDWTKISAEEALALKVQCNLSDDSYQMIKNATKEHNCDIFPSLHKIAEVKSKCYPADLKFTETSAQSTLQSMVNHTLTRIVSVSEESLRSFSRDQELQVWIHLINFN